jgi:hypothetical protein
MDRRHFLTGTAAFVTGPTALPYGDEAMAQGDPEFASRQLVYDLEPEAPIPTDYPGYMSIDEINRHIKECETNRFIACYPILEGDVPKVQRYFRSWSLFLISNPEWLSAESDDRISELHNAYTAFSRAIGDSHAAVFFWKKKPKVTAGRLESSNLAVNIDAARCAAYATALQLDTSRSPHIVVTTTRPSPDSKLSKSLILELNGARAASVMRLLTLLSAQLITQKLNQADLDTLAWWLGWKDAFLKVLEAVTDRGKVTIKAGPVEWESSDGK